MSPLLLSKKFYFIKKRGFYVCCKQDHSVIEGTSLEATISIFQSYMGMVSQLGGSTVDCFKWIGQIK